MRMLRAEALSTMELVLPLLCLCVLSCSGSTSAAGAEPERIIVKEGRDVILPCSTTGDITYERFEWKKDGQKEVYVYDGGVVAGQDEQFKGRVSHFPGELKTGNGSITIRNTVVTDTGNYTCEFPRLSQKVFISLLVVAASKPSVTIREVTKDWALLQCEVRGASPKAVLQWQDSDGNIIPAKEPQVSERGGSYDIILQTNVTKTHSYRCVATQKEIKHTVQAETHVYISGPEPKSPTGWIVAVVVLGTLFVGGVIILIVFIKKGYITLNYNSGQSKTRVPQEDL